MAAAMAVAKASPLFGEERGGGGIAIALPFNTIFICIPRCPPYPPTIVVW